MLDSKETEKKELYDWLRRIGQQFNSAFVITDPNCPGQPVVYANESFTNITGYRKEEILGEESLFLIGKDIEFEMVEELNESIQREATSKIELLNYKKDKSPFWNDMFVQSIHGDNGEHLYNVAIFTDNTHYKQQEMVVRLEQEIYGGIEKGLPVKLLLQKICYMTERFFPQGARCSILQIVDEEYMTVGAADSLPIEYNAFIDGLQIGMHVGSCGTAAFTKQNVIVDDMEQSEHWAVFLDVVKKHKLKACWSFPVVNHKNQVIATFGVYFSESRVPSETDFALIEKVTPLVSLALKTAEYQEKIHNLAYIDALSGIANYNYFIDQFAETIYKDTTGFVLLIQSSEYGNIVDSYGKKQLAFFQKQMYERIQELFSDIEIIIARSSEASLIVAGKCEEEEIPYYIYLLLETTKEPIIVNNIEIFISIKVGAVSLSYYDGHNIDDIVRLADVTMSQAKKKAGNSIVFYKERFSEDLKEKINIQNELIRAIKNNEIYIQLQPKVNTFNGEIVSFEALARWNSAVLGQVPPTVFIKTAETIGKIQEIDFIIIDQVLQWLQSRKLNDMPLYQVSVNISVGHFYAQDFIEMLLAVVSRYEVEPKYLKIELTENISLFDLNKAQQILNELRANGFESSVDDFGIGFSSLSYLHKLPVSEIKIDRSFIQNIHEQGASAVVETIIHLANNLGMKAVAEGIETEEQLRIMKKMRCPIIQGYYFYKPMSLEEVNRLV